MLQKGSQFVLLYIIFRTDVHCVNLDLNHTYDHFNPSLFQQQKIFMNVLKTCSPYVHTHTFMTQSLRVVKQCSMNYKHHAHLYTFLLFLFY